MSTPAERIRRALQDAQRPSAIERAQDALTALAELERERENQVQVCARLASERACEMVRADVAERERDELRGRLSEIEDFARFVVRTEEEITPRRAMILLGEEIARLRKRLDEYEQAPTIMTRGDGLELIARQTRKDSE